MKTLKKCVGALSKQEVTNKHDVSTIIIPSQVGGKKARIIFLNGKDIRAFQSEEVKNQNYTFTVEPRGGGKNTQWKLVYDKNLNFYSGSFGIKNSSPIAPYDLTQKELLSLIESNPDVVDKISNKYLGQIKSTEQNISIGVERGLRKGWETSTDKIYEKQRRNIIRWKENAQKIKVELKNCTKLKNSFISSLAKKVDQNINQYIKDLESIDLGSIISKVEGKHSIRQQNRLHKDRHGKYNSHKRAPPKPKRNRRFSRSDICLEPQIPSNCLYGFSQTKDKNGCPQTICRSTPTPADDQREECVKLMNNYEQPSNNDLQPPETELMQGVEYHKMAHIIRSMLNKAKEVVRRQYFKESDQAKKIEMSNLIRKLTSYMSQVNKKQIKLYKNTNPSTSGLGLVTQYGTLSGKNKGEYLLSKGLGISQNYIDQFHLDPLAATEQMIQGLGKIDRLGSVISPIQLVTPNSYYRRAYHDSQIYRDSLRKKSRDVFSNIEVDIKKLNEAYKIDLSVLNGWDQQISLAKTRGNDSRFLQGMEKNFTPQLKTLIDKLKKVDKRTSVSEINDLFIKANTFAQHEHLLEKSIGKLASNSKEDERWKNFKQKYSEFINFFNSFVKKNGEKLYSSIDKNEFSWGQKRKISSNAAEYEQNYIKVYGSKNKKYLRCRRKYKETEGIKVNSN